MVANQAINGHLDLAHHNPNQPVNLAGQWLEAWGQLVQPSVPFSGVAVALPQGWNTTSIHSGQGIATYQLSVSLPAGVPLWGLKLPTIQTAYRLWANQDLIAQGGIPGAFALQTVPGTGPRAVYFHIGGPDPQNLILTLQLANFSYPKTGIQENLVLASAPTVQRRQSEDQLGEFALLGALTVLAIYYLAMSFLPNSNGEALWLALFGTVVLLRLISTSHNLMFLLSPYFAWDIQIKLGLMILNLGALPLLFFYRKAFPAQFGRWMPTLMTALFIVFAGVLFLFPLTISTHLISLMELFIGLSFIYVLARLGRAIQQKIDGARVTFILTLILAVASVNDMLFSQQVISTAYLMPLAFLTFLLFQALSLARQILHTFTQVEVQRDQLDRANHSMARFVPDGFLASLGKKSIVEVELGQQALTKMVVMFADIRRFTALADKIEPEKTFRMLNSYFGRVGPVIRAHGGFIDKYMGDGFMALFPDDPDSGLQAAVDLQKAVQVYNGHRANFNYPAINVGCGVHGGPLVIGTIGEESRMDTTVISSVVNLTSRLESLTKIFGHGTLVTISFLDTLEHPENFHWRYAGVVRMYGKQDALEVAHVWDGLTDDEAQLYAENKVKFEEGVYLYRTGQMAEAEQVFLEVLSRHPSDIGAKYYATRAKLLHDFGLPDNWDAIEDQLQK